MKLLFLESFRSKSAWVWGIFLYLVGAFIVYTYILSLYNPIKIIDNPTIPQGVIAGDSFEICRIVDYSRRAKVDVGRSMTQTRNKQTHTLSYPSFSLIRKKGRYFICRDIKLPEDMNGGIWTVHTYLTIHTPPFWKTNIETKKFQINVLKGCK